MDENISVKYQEIVAVLQKACMELPAELANPVKTRLEIIIQSKYKPDLLAKNLIEIFQMLKENPGLAGSLYDSLAPIFKALEPAYIPESDDERYKGYQSTLGAANAPLAFPLYVCPKDPDHEFDYKCSQRQVMICPNPIHKNCALVPAVELLKKEG